MRDGAAPESRRLAEFGTERPGLSQKFRSYRRFCACGKSVEKGAGDKALKVAQTQSRRCPCQAPSCMQGDYEKDLTGNFLIIMERLARSRETQMTFSRLTYRVSAERNWNSCRLPVPA